MRFKVSASKLITIFIIALGILAPSLSAEPRVSNQVDITPHKASKLSEKIGINTILVNNSYGFHPNSTVFQDIVKPKLEELGIKWVRDSIPAGEVHETLRRHSLKLHSLSGSGIKFLLTTFPNRENINNASVIADEIRKINCLKNGCTTGNQVVISGNANIKAIGVTNEQDAVASYLSNCETASAPAIPNHLTTSLEKAFFCFPNWPTQLLFFAESFRSQIKGNSALSSLSLVAPTLVNVPEYRETSISYENTLWDVMKPIAGYVDYASGNLYDYLRPATSSSINNEITERNEFFTHDEIQKKLIVTEFGYYTDPMGTPDFTVSAQDVQSKNTVRSIFNYILRDNIERAFLFELLDRPNAGNARERSFGLLEEDGSEKEVFRTLKNLFSIFSDASDSSSLEPLSIDIVNASGTVKSALFQKSNGTYLLALWNNPNSSVVSGVDNNQSASIRLLENSNFRVFRPSLGIESIQEKAFSTSLEVSVPDDVIIVEISIVPPTPTPTPVVQPSPNVTPDPSHGADGQDCKLVLVKVSANKFSVRAVNATRTLKLSLNKIKGASRKGVWRKELGINKRISFKTPSNLSNKEKLLIVSDFCGKAKIKRG